MEAEVSFQPGPISTSEAVVTHTPSSVATTEEKSRAAASESAIKNTLIVPMENKVNAPSTDACKIC